MRVGRGPLERDVLREIERQNPGIHFDWNAVREHQQIIEPPPEYRRRRAPRREEQADEARVPLPADAPPAAAAPAAGPSLRPSIPPVLEGSTPDEQIAFLERTYPGVRDRVLQRTDEPRRRDALLALAERLNPAAWTDADQITAGLQAASEALERLGRVLSRRRRRGRRRPAAESDDGLTADQSTTPAGSDEQDDEPSS